MSGENGLPRATLFTRSTLPAKKLGSQTPPTLKRQGMSRTSLSLIPLRPKSGYFALGTPRSKLHNYEFISRGQSGQKSHYTLYMWGQRSRRGRCWLAARVFCNPRHGTLRPFLQFFEQLPEVTIPFTLLFSLRCNVGNDFLPNAGLSFTVIGTRPPVQLSGLWVATCAGCQWRCNDYSVPKVDTNVVLICLF